MRFTHWPAVAGSTILAALLGCSPAPGQSPPAVVKGGKAQEVKPPPDEFRAVLNEVKEAYKAPLEVDEDVLKQLRRSYQQPSPDREAKILKEVRRLYQTTPDHEDAILREIRRAYQQPTVEQEERIFREIRRLGTLPLGTVPVDVQFQMADKLFRKLDQDGDGVLSSGEMADQLREQRARWDTNRDGVIDQAEYRPYSQAHLQSVSERVASGEIALNLPNAPKAAPAPAAEAPPAAVRAGKLPAGLPDWFSRLDTDGDGQIGLYEWKDGPRPLEEFARADRNGDNFITAAEALFALAQPTRAQPAPEPTTIRMIGDRGKEPKRAVKEAVKALRERKTKDDKTRGKKP